VGAGRTVGFDVGRSVATRHQMYSRVSAETRFSLGDNTGNIQHDD